MNAITYHSYGSPAVLHTEKIAPPTVRENEILIRTCAAAANPHDWHFLTGTPLLARLMAGLFKPTEPVLGVDVAGQVAVIGSHVAQFRVGDAVFGTCDHGCFADYVAVPAAHVAPMPANLSFDQAAAVPLAGLTALQGLRDHGQLQAGQRVLIHGASGGVGTFAVQIAKVLGADVTGICSTRNMELVGSLGADRVIDYTREDFTASGQHYDLIFDVVRKRTFAGCRHVLTPRGRFVTTEVSLPLLIRQGWTSLRGGRQLVPMLAKPGQADLLVLKEWLEAGTVVPVIDRQFPLAGVPDALRYLREGHARGKVIIAVADAQAGAGGSSETTTGAAAPAGASSTQSAAARATA